MISIVICSIDAAKFSAVSRCYNELLAGEPHEIVRISNAASLAEGYNRGLAQSKGEIVIFSHDDIHILTRDFANRLKRHMETYDVIGVAGTTRLISPLWSSAGHPYIFGQVAHAARPDLIVVDIYSVPRRVINGIHAMDGLFLAFRREVIASVTWDEQTFNGFHGYDVDCTFRAHLAGHKLAVVNDIPILHQSGGSYDQKFQYYAQLFMNKHARQLDKMMPRKYSHGMVEVPTRSMAIEVMSPNFWPD